MYIHQHAMVNRVILYGFDMISSGVPCLDWTEGQNLRPNRCSKIFRHVENGKNIGIFHPKNILAINFRSKLWAFWKKTSRMICCGPYKRPKMSLKMPWFLLVTSLSGKLNHWVKSLLYPHESCEKSPFFC